MITTIYDFEVIWRIKLSDGFFYSLKTDIVEDKYLKIVGGVEDIFLDNLERQIGISRWRRLC